MQYLSFFKTTPIARVLSTEPQKPESEDRFEFLDFFSKAASNISHFLLLNKFKIALGSNLPETYQKLFYELDPEESPILDGFLNKLSRSQGPEETIALMSETDMALVEISSPKIQELLDLVKNLCANKSLINTQFATDSLGILLNLEDPKVERYYGNTLGLQELIFKKDMSSDEQKFANEMEEARLAAHEEDIPGAQWTLACTPGLGYMSHAGWEHTSCPTLEQPSLFHGVRTLGLTKHGKTCFTRVPLDFSELGELSLEQATVLLKAVISNADKEKPDLDPMSEVDPRARAIIIQFSQDLTAACLQIHRGLQEFEE
ncbi:MAG: hypothetical protein WCK42_07755 [Myxococcaceae bacterium]